MDEALDLRTWLTITGAVFGSFLVPCAMLVYDHRRQRHRKQQRLPSAPTDRTDMTAQARANRHDTGPAGVHRQDNDCR